MADYSVFTKRVSNNFKFWAYKSSRRALWLIAFSSIAAVVNLGHAKADDFTGLYPKASPEVEQRVATLLGQMTEDEKLNILGGGGFNVKPIDHLKLPSLKMSDGPVGTRNDGATTAFPAGICLAATWNVDVARMEGVGLGRDGRSRGDHILLGPGVNIYRVPVNGRNFEYMGEDPWLASRIAVQYVLGVQSQGVAACIKHYACNNQEHDRNSIDVQVDERTLREIYLPVFEAAVKEANVCTLMASYNRINGYYATANEFLETTALKQDWGFQGFIMSDWGATHEVLGTAKAGLDLEMPKGDNFNPKKLGPLVQGGQITQAIIDDKVRRILRVAVAMGWLDRPQGDGSISRNDPQSNAAALQSSREGTVLLKNDGNLLPLDKTKIKNIVVVGPCAEVIGGGGSSGCKPSESTTIVQGLTALGGADVKVSQIKNAGKAFSDDELQQIKNADAVFACVGFNGAPHTYEGEGPDRPYELQAGQNELIQAAAKANPKTVVILYAGGNVAMSGWIDSVAGLIDAWYPGQEGGKALAEIIFGDVNPSGRLPATLEKEFKDCPAFENYPGQGKEYYKEGVLVGYRYYDTKKVEPRYCFGYGLSYTTFDFKNLKVDAQGAGDDRKVTVTVDVTNTGKRAGAEVAQLYVRPPQGGTVERPFQELKGFGKVMLNPGETKTVTMTLNMRSFAYYDVDAKGWKVIPGTYDLAAGGSSRDTPLVAKYQW